jgi:hypothetical protein
MSGQEKASENGDVLDVVVCIVDCARGNLDQDTGHLSEVDRRDPKNRENDEIDEDFFACIVNSCI